MANERCIVGESSFIFLLEHVDNLWTMQGEIGGD